MILITTPADLRRLAEDPGLPRELRETVEECFWGVWRAAGGGDPAAFSLAPFGPIAVLEPGDPLDALPGAGRTAAEWADAVAFDGAAYYDAGFLEGNDRCWHVLGRVGALHPAVEAFLARAVHGDAAR